MNKTSTYEDFTAGQFVHHVTSGEAVKMVVIQKIEGHKQIQCRFVTQNGIFTENFEPSELIPLRKKNASNLGVSFGPNRSSKKFAQ